ncbi:hypothetical protein H072_5982 [Dactylellina haptotyla CBS 200.50]|uniref:Uncharacterized protein n=1 Tax=Dactylellina haptotyla (strain CBS 200.50) TaxID=1284197 RepID=S8BXV9_DACHA|nr:hypothetical protein H072_5982 [Dactylellina haptotyla CBS 200.50]
MDPLQLADSVFSSTEAITQLLNTDFDGDDYLSIPNVDSRQAERVRETIIHDRAFQVANARFTYDSEFQQIRVTKPNVLVNTAAGWLQAQEQYWKARGMLSAVCENYITSMTGIEFRGFTAPHDKTTKTLNICLMPWTSLFPSIVVETGYTQPATDLERDKDIWKTSTNGETKVVIITKFSKTPRNTVSCVLGIHRVNGTGGLGACSKYTIFPAPQSKAEQIYHISLGELYGGECPPGVDADTELPLNITELRNICRQALLSLNLVPD